MRFARVLKHRFRALFRHSRVEDELQQELSLHLELLRRENAESGASEPEARAAARRAFGSVPLIEARCRDERRVHLIRDLMKDLAYSFRLLRHSPGFTITALLTLALGIGANTAIFALVNAVLMRPLPYREPDRLVHLWETRHQTDFARMEASYPDFEDWIRQSRSFAALAGYNSTNFTLTGSGSPVRISGTRVTSNFFSVLGVTPLLGRDFRPEEQLHGRIAIVSYGFWQDQFGGSPEALGKSLLLGGVRHTIVGVLPAGFQFALNRSDVLVPLNAAPDALSRRSLHWLRPIGRLADGISLEQAQAEMSVIASRLSREHPQSNAGVGIQLVDLRREIVGKVEPVLLVLFGAVALVLLLACVNLANLLLARAAARAREFAVRAALGAGEGRLIRQLLAETCMLSILGGAAALALSYWGIHSLLTFTRETSLAGTISSSDLVIDRTVLGFNFAISFLTGLLFGLLPAWNAARKNPAGSLREWGRTSQGRKTWRLRQILVVAEVALSLMLLVGNGLILRSLHQLLNVNPGMETRNVVSMSLSLPAVEYREEARVISFYDELRRRASTIPGVESAAVIDELPLTQDGGTVHLFVEGKPEPAPGEEHEAVVRSASPGYFETLRIPILCGRSFGGQDRPGTPRVVILSETLARRLFSDEDPTGRSIVLSFDRSRWKIVGVAGDVRMGGLDKPGRPAFYSCAPQDPSRSANLVMRTSLNLEGLALQIREQVRALDPEIPVYAIRTMEDVMNRSTAVFVRRSVACLLSLFAALSLVLAVTGVYGVVSYTVAQRTPEFGLRVALGADPGAIIRLVFREGAWLGLAGTLLGAVGAAALTRTMEHLLFGISPFDLWTFLAMSALAAAAGAVASYVPARRAGALDPVAALHGE